MKLFNISEVSKSRQRFNILGIKGMVGYRMYKKRYGFQTGSTFKALHFGRKTLYIESIGGRKLGRGFVA